MTIEKTTKSAQIRAAIERGDWHKAFSIASKFPQLGTDRAAILDAWTAISNPNFCRQLGKDPAALIEAGKAPLIRIAGA